jgi:hypothetical protein
VEGALVSRLFFLVAISPPPLLFPPHRRRHTKTFTNQIQQSNNPTIQPITRHQTINQTKNTKGLERDAAGLRREIRERDDALGDKEARVGELKRRNTVRGSRLGRVG